MMQPKEKLFLEIINLEKEIKDREARIKALQARAVKLKWAEMGDDYETKRAPSKKWWEANQPELFQEMIKHYVTSTNKGRFNDGGFKERLAKAIAAEIA
jgi:hypothetical protein